MLSMKVRSLAFALSVLVPTPDVLAAEPQVGRCHMDKCSWRKQVSRELMGSSPVGALHRVTLLGGEARDRLGKPVIKWNRKPHDVFVFCSKKLPAVMMRIEDGLQIDALAISPDEDLPPVYDTAVSIYLEVCHNAADSDVHQIARQFGYAVSSEDVDALGQRIKTPADVLALE